MAGWQFRKLDRWVQDGKIELGRGDVISKGDISSQPGPYPIYSSSAHNNGKFGEYAQFMFDEELITWSVDGGGSFFYRPKHKFSVTNVCGYMRIKSANLDPAFVFYCLADQHRHLAFDYTTKAHPSVIRKLYHLPEIHLCMQKKIACILQTIDQAIEKTEALIDKYQQIMAGLMHDLFTRGIGPNGQLRPPRDEAPELYHETPIGWIPKEWEVMPVSEVLESIIDGPFGSNLKTEHYVEDAGVRVVRLQNVAEYEYNDSDRAYVSDAHAAKLIRNQVLGTDVLIAGLGEERYPVGRSCIYPQGLAPAINKADCFRARCKSECAENQFFMLFLNSLLARKQVRRYEQGVTRPRINTSNLKRLRVAVPSLKEQKAVCAHFSCFTDLIAIERKKREKLDQQKAGLMHDLLSGKATVPVEPEAEPENVSA